MLNVRSVNLWWYRLKFPMLTPHLRGQHHQHRDVLQDYFEKFAEHPEDQKLAKLCKDAGFLKKIEKG